MAILLDVNGGTSPHLLFKWHIFQPVTRLHLSVRKIILIVACFHYVK